MYKGIQVIQVMLDIHKIDHVTELMFSKTEFLIKGKLKKRRFRFDFAIEDKKIAIEYEGVYKGKSRHTTASGYSEDTIKYNLAVIEGWRVLRYTASTVHKFENDILTLLKN